MGLYGPFTKPEVMNLFNIQDEIHSCHDNQTLSRLISKYGSSNNPDTLYHLGVRCFLQDKKEDAFNILKKGASYGLKVPNEYLDSIFSDSIGQCFFHISNTLKKGTEKDFVYAYFYLSNCTRLSKDSYDSFKSRAILINENPLYSTRLISDYLGLSAIKDPLVIADYYYAGQGFDDNPREKSNCRNRAQSMHQRLEDLTVAGRDADEYSLAEMALVGEARHNAIYTKLLNDILMHKY
jgi:hypothetical protein